MIVIFIDDDPGFDVDRLDLYNGLLFSIQSSKNFDCYKLTK